MTVLERHYAAVAPAGLPGTGVDERDARKTLRDQIARLEAELGYATVSAYPRLPVGASVAGFAGPRLLDLGELERTRDELAEKLARMRDQVSEQADVQSEKRLLIERMLLDPGRYKWVRVSGTDIGEHACKHWHVRPRLGLIGMLAGWWHVKVSSGCPLAAAA
jgi:hypothetical protein